MTKAISSPAKTGQEARVRTIPALVPVLSVLSRLA